MPILGRLRGLFGLRKDAEKAGSLIKILEDERRGERRQAHTEYGLLVVLIALAIAALALYFLRK